MESSDLILRFNSATCYWENLGDADWFAEQQTRREYQENPIVWTIKKLLEQMPQGWEGTAQQLLEAGRFIARTSLASTSRELSSRLKELDRLFLECDGIVHDRVRHGTGGGKHRFYFSKLDQSCGEQAKLDQF